MRNYSRVVGTYNPDNLHIVKAVLSSVTKGTLLSMSSITAAEASKIFETAYRDVNIALANEFALLCEKLGIDYYETMEAANSQPYSHLHRPSVGVGGHCIPVYPYLLLDLAKDIGIKLRLVKEARRINEFAPKRVVHLAAAALRELGKPLARSRIAILGLSYRENVKELRLSPTLDLITLLLKRGVNITIYDPNYQLSEIRNLGYNMEVATTIQSALKDVHCTVIMVAHDEFRSLTPEDLAAYIGGSAAIIDGPGIFTPMDIKRVGLVYRGIGKGVVQ
jgi:nucleotide sugar dehydrogenase